MTYAEIIDIAANWAAILTAIIASIAYWRYFYAQCSQRRALEKYLRDEKESGMDNGQRTVMHLVARLSMTEAEVFESAFRSKKIGPVISQDEKGRADRILFEYIGDDLPLPNKF